MIISMQKYRKKDSSALKINKELGKITATLSAEDDRISDTISSTLRALKNIELSLRELNNDPKKS